MIVGSNRVEFCKIRKRDFEKIFFYHRGDIYPIFTGNLVKMRFYDEKGDEFAQPEEVIIFPEGSSVPYDIVPGMEPFYWQENVLPTIDLFRAVPSRRPKRTGILSGASRVTDALYPFIGAITLVLVLGYAFLA